jgi:hypothetical protein
MPGALPYPCPDAVLRVMDPQLPGTPCCYRPPLLFPLLPAPRPFGPHPSPHGVGSHDRGGTTSQHRLLSDSIPTGLLNGGGGTGSGLPPSRQECRKLSIYRENLPPAVGRHPHPRTMILFMRDCENIARPDLRMWIPQSLRTATTYRDIPCIARYLAMKGLRRWPA